MIQWWWSWLLSAFGITGIWLAGSKRSVGWLIGIMTQFLWITYAVVSHQYGFILASLCYGGVYLRNYLAWRKSEKRTWIPCDNKNCPTCLERKRNEKG